MIYAATLVGSVVSLGTFSFAGIALLVALILSPVSLILRAIQNERAAKSALLRAASANTRRQ